MAGIRFEARSISSRCQRLANGSVCQNKGRWACRSYALRSSALAAGSGNPNDRFLDTSDMVNPKHIHDHYPYKGAYRLVGEKMYLQKDALLKIPGAPRLYYRVPESLAWETSVDPEGVGGLFAHCIHPEKGPRHLPVLPLMEKAAQGLGQRLRMGLRHVFPELFIIFQSWSKIASKGPVREGERLVLWADFNAAKGRVSYDKGTDKLGIVAPLSFRGFSLGMDPQLDASTVALGKEKEIFRFEAMAAISNQMVNIADLRKIEQNRESLDQAPIISAEDEPMEPYFRARYPKENQRPFWGFDHLLQATNDQGIPLALKNFNPNWPVFGDHMGFASGISLLEILLQRLAYEGMSVRGKNLPPEYFGHFRLVCLDRVKFNNVVFPEDRVIIDIGTPVIEEIDPAAGTFDVVTPKVSMVLSESQETLRQAPKDRQILEARNLRLRLWLPPAV